MDETQSRSAMVNPASGRGVGGGRGSVQAQEAATETQPLHLLQPCTHATQHHRSPSQTVTATPSPAACCNRPHIAALQHRLINDACVIIQASSQAQVKRDGAERTHGIQEVKQRRQLGQSRGAVRVLTQGVGGVLQGGQQRAGLPPAGQTAATTWQAGRLGIAACRCRSKTLHPPIHPPTPSPPTPWICIHVTKARDM